MLKKQCNGQHVTHNLPDLPTGRGGQSALRFARLRMEKRHNYVRKVSVAVLVVPPHWTGVPACVLMIWVADCNAGSSAKCKRMRKLR